MKTGTERRYNPYRRVRQEGGSAVLTLGAIIPKTWNMVKIELQDSTDTERVIKIKKVR